MSQLLVYSVAAALKFSFPLLFVSRSVALTSMRGGTVVNFCDGCDKHHLWLGDHFHRDHALKFTFVACTEVGCSCVAASSGGDDRGELS